MFGFFKKEKIAKESYKMLKTERDKYQVLFDDIKRKVEVGEKVLLVYFFDGTGEEIVKILDVLNISYSFNEQTLNAHQVAVWKVADYLKQESNSSTFVFAAEFHPSRLENVSLLTYLDKGSEVVFYSELDSRYFSALGMDNLIIILERLGLKDEEAVEHSMVTKSLIRCQEKVEGIVRTPFEALNLEEWMTKNVPERNK